MKKTAFQRIIPIFLALLIVLAVPLCSWAEDSIPMLKSIEFSNAELDDEFEEGKMEYSITLTDPNQTPIVTKYTPEDLENVNVTYLTDGQNRQTGIQVILSFDTGSRIYTFNYSNPPDYINNNNNTLSGIECSFGELDPAFDPSITSYTLYIPSDLDTISITPITSDIHAYCRPYRELKLGADKSTAISLTCIASDGTSRDYNIEVKRVEKTVDEVQTEMLQPDYTSFVENEKLYQKPELWIIVAVCVAGVALLYYLFKITKRISVTPYDKEEKEFYKSE